MCERVSKACLEKEPLCPREAAVCPPLLVRRRMLVPHTSTHSLMYLYAPIHSLFTQIGAAIADALLKEHINATDKSFASIEGEAITAGNVLLPDLIKGNNQISLLYSCSIVTHSLTHSLTNS